MSTIKQSLYATTLSIAVVAALCIGFFATTAQADADTAPDTGAVVAVSRSEPVLATMREVPGLTVGIGLVLAEANAGLIEVAENAATDRDQAAAAAAQATEARRAEAARQAEAARAAAAPAGSVTEIIARHFGSLAGEAIRVARCESKLDPLAVSRSNDHGVFQINIVHQVQFQAVTGQPWSQVYNPEYNVRYARWLYSQEGWGPWACAWAA